MVHNHQRRAGFTLVELIAVMTIVLILAGLIVVAAAQARAVAAENKTRSTITRLNTKLTFMWEQYRHRRVPLVRMEQDYIPPEGPRARALGRGNLAMRRLVALWEMQRFEMPQSFGEVLLTNNLLPSRPAMAESYRAQLQAAGADPDVGQFQSAECLYLIMTVGLGSDGLGPSALGDGSIGDVDDNGLPEFLDGWGRPLRFWRWPSGFVSDLQPSGALPQYNQNPVRGQFEQGMIAGIPTIRMEMNHDPFNPVGIVPFPDAPAPRNFALMPLIVSAGADGVFNLEPVANSQDPFGVVGGSGLQSGALRLFDNPPTRMGQHLDNIHSHMSGMR